MFARVTTTPSTIPNSDVRIETERRRQRQRQRQRQRDRQRERARERERKRTCFTAMDKLAQRVQGKQNGLQFWKKMLAVLHFAVAPVNIVWPGVEMKYMGGPSRRTKPEMAAVVLHL